VEWLEPVIELILKTGVDMSKFLTATIVIAVAAGALAKEDYPTISAVKGQVYFHYKNGPWQPVRVGQQLGGGVRVKTVGNSWVHLTIFHPNAHRCIESNAEVYFDEKKEGSLKSLRVLRGHVTHLNLPWAKLARRGEYHYFAACLLDERGRVEAKAPGEGWRRVTGHHDVYAGVRLRTRNGSRAKIRISSGEIATLPPNTEIEVPINRPWPILADIKVLKGRLTKA
jgi:hypothetical protein